MSRVGFIDISQSQIANTSYYPARFPRTMIGLDPAIEGSNCNEKGSAAEKERCSRRIDNGCAVAYRYDALECPFRGELWEIASSHSSISIELRKE